jgi:PAS domain S-box-containing protein
MVTIIAPVVIKGEYGGYVTGVLSLDQIKEFLIRSTEHNAKFFALIDKNGNVIMTNRTDQKVMTPFTRAHGTLTRLDTRISLWIPKLPPNTPASERWKKSIYVAEVSIGDLAEWKLILEQPIAPFQKALYENYTGKLIMLFLILLGALALAEFLSRRFISTQENLQLITRDLPAKVAEGANIDWPESGILEIHNLVGNFKETSNSLGALFHEIRQINESLEQRVEERTVQLSNVMNELDIILGNAPVGIAKIVDRKLVWCNRKLTEMFNYSKDELISQTTRMLYPSEEAFEKLGVEAYPHLTQGLVFETEQELISKDGVPIQARYIGKAIDPADMTKGTIWLIEDITRRKHEEEERKAFEHQFQETQKLESLGVLAGGIAHDFNNLLMVIMGNCALAKIAPETSENRITEIEKASERAAALCRQMLEYAGHSHTVKSQINMGMLVTDMVEMLSSTGHKNVTINPVITPNIPSIYGDASQIRQIAMNLIINATEAIGDAQGEINVMVSKYLTTDDQPEKDHLGRVIPAGMYVCLEVTDQGCGMDEETRRRIFEPFFTTKFTGRGLGLSATLGIISGHDGALQVFSHPGKGTTFKVYLPAQVKTSGGDESHQQVKSPVPWQGSGTILLVEDEENVRFIAKTILMEFGFDVIEAVNGREALELYQKDSAKINIVITDIGMPVMDGYELFFELKKVIPELPIIISTGFGDKAVTSRIPREDMAGLISKPYTMGQMQEVLKSVVGGIS